MNPEFPAPEAGVLTKFDYDPYFKIQHFRTYEYNFLIEFDIMSTSALSIYLGFDLVLSILWVLIFYFRIDLRKKMIRLSLIGAIAGPISQFWYLSDYWRPFNGYGVFSLLADLLFGAFVVSLTGCSYNVLFKTKSILSKQKSKYILGIRKTIFDILLIIGVLIILTNFFKINSIYSSAIAFLILTVFVWIERHDLIKISLIGAIILFFSTAIGYLVILSFYPNFINETWLLQGISGISILGIPVEEFLWFTTWGLLGAPLYEWGHGYKFEKIF